MSIRPGGGSSVAPGTFASLDGVIPKASAQVPATVDVRPVGYTSSLIADTSGCAIALPDQTRTKVIIQNLGTVNVTLGYRNDAGRNAPGSFPDTIAPGQEAVLQAYKYSPWVKAASGTATVRYRIEHVGSGPTANLAAPAVTTIRSIVEVLPLASTTVTFADSGGYGQVGISSDGKTGLWAHDTTFGLYTSTDDGATKTLAKTFAARVEGAWQLSDGEVLASVGVDGNATGTLWRSTGWVANPTTATWTQVLTAQCAGAVFTRRYGGVNVNPDGVILAMEWGTHTGAEVTALGKVNSQAAVHAYRSTDNGLTFTQILDISALAYLIAAGLNFTNPAMHGHGIAWDRYWQRIWITFGDNASQTLKPTATVIAYADVAADGSIGTFTPVPFPTGSFDDASAAVWQSVQPTVMPNCILFGPDGSPGGVRRIARLGYRQMGPLQSIQLIPTYTATGGSVAISYSLTPPQYPGAPALITITSNGTMTSGTGLTRIVATRDGFEFFELVRDPLTYTAGWGFWSAFLSASGKVTGSMYWASSGQPADAKYTNRARFTVPFVEPLPAAATSRGSASVADGGTIAHGLGYTPRGPQLTPSVAGRRAAVTAVDATNITVSLTDAAGSAVAVAETVYWMAGA